MSRTLQPRALLLSGPRSSSLAWAFLTGLLLLLGGCSADLADEIEGCQGPKDCPADQVCGPDGRCALPAEGEGEGEGGEGEGEGGEGEGEGGEGEGEGSEGEGEGEGECEPGAAQPCAETADVGRCRGGSRSCEGGHWGPCVGVIPPQAEACNGEDDDCDGQTDEELTPPPAGSGVCEGLTAACAGATGWTVPYPETHEALELTCDGLDNDCDGLTDEELVVPADVDCGPGLCATVTPACAGGGWSCALPAGHEAEEASCDGLDNDCDGDTDEALLPPEGVSCLDLGVCASVGPTCGGAQRWICVYPASREQPESSCDGLDNDCDGQVDEGLSAPADLPCLTAGVCRGTSPSCTGLGGWACRYPETHEPVEASCDGLDNDCDDEVDEALVPPVTACLAAGVCAGTTARCDGAQGWSCTYPETYQAGAETTCDGLDNDCDDQLDEGLTVPPPGTCLTAGVCAAAAPICAGALGWDCRYPAAHLPDGEGATCNDQDDDCDGQTDEGFVYQEQGGRSRAFGEPCDGVWRCGPGLVECRGQRLVCSSDPEGSATGARPEVCNGLDDDCDGVPAVDEQDQDADGVPACLGDCDDQDPAIHAGLAALADWAGGTGLPAVVAPLDYCDDGADFNCSDPGSGGVEQQACPFEDFGELRPKQVTVRSYAAAFVAFDWPGHLSGIYAVLPGNVQGNRIELPYGHNVFSICWHRNKMYVLDQDYGFSVVVPRESSTLYNSSRPFSDWTSSPIGPFTEMVCHDDGTTAPQFHLAGSGNSAFLGSSVNLEWAPSGEGPFFLRRAFGAKMMVSGSQGADGTIEFHHFVDGPVGARSLQLPLVALAADSPPDTGPLAFAATADGRLHQYSLTTDQLLSVVRPETAPPIDDLDVSLDHTVLAVLTGGQIELRDPRTLALLRMVGLEHGDQVFPDCGPVRGIDVSLDRTLAGRMRVFAAQSCVDQSTQVEHFWVTKVE